MTTDRPGCDECAEKDREIARLRKALRGIFGMAYEWHRHGGSDTTFGDEYGEDLEFARAALGDET